MAVEIIIALISATGVVIGMFLRIEHRLTKVETKIDFIQENMPGCQPNSDKNLG